MKEWNTQRLKEGMAILILCYYVPELSTITGLDTNEPSLNEWVEILYRDGDIPPRFSGFSRLLAMLAISQDIREFIGAADRFRCIPYEGRQRSRLEWTHLLSKCYERLTQTLCVDETWPLHKELISQSYHYTVMTIQVAITDIYAFVGFKANYHHEIDVTRYRLSTWMLEQPESIQVALLHALQIFIQLRVQKTKSPHAPMVLCFAVLVIWAYIELKIGPLEMELGRCSECNKDTLSSLDHCCLQAALGHELSDFELGLIQGKVQVDNLIRESCALLHAMPFWQSHGVVSVLTYYHQSVKGSKSTVTFPP